MSNLLISGNGRLHKEILILWVRVLLIIILMFLIAFFLIYLLDYDGDARYNLVIIVIVGVVAAIQVIESIFAHFCIARSAVYVYENGLYVKGVPPKFSLRGRFKYFHWSMLKYKLNYDQITAVELRGKGALIIRSIEGDVKCCVTNAEEIWGVIMSKAPDLYKKI